MFKTLFISSMISFLAYSSPVQEIEPTFDARADVRFLIFTQANRLVGQEAFLGNIGSLRATNYDASRPTRVIIHGFQNDASSEVNTLITEAYLTSFNLNIIVVDWGVGAQTVNFVAARQRVNEVAPIVAEFLNHLHDNNELDLSRLYIVGYSLGAHISGITAKNIKGGRVNTIIGLDPAGPLFDLNNPTLRLDFTDAEYVEVIHTDGQALGIGNPIGHVDVFPNGGNVQPGCATSICNHRRAYEFFAESINSNRLWARRCNNLAEVATGCFGEGFSIGGEPSNRGINLRGIFHMTTNNASPFGRGEF